MFKWLFNSCEHNYRILKSFTEPYHDGSMWKVYRGYILYCPKCDREKRVNADKYDLEESKKIVKRRYEKRGY